MRLDLPLAAALAAGLLLSLQGVRALGADGLKPEQERMRSCNTQADQQGLQDGERNHFMRSCLKGANGNAHQLTARQRRSEECNRLAKSRRLEGAERRGFMSECEEPPVKQQVADSEKMKSCAKRADQRRLDDEERNRYLSGCRSAASASAGR